ncbi:MAG: site-specific integrase [Candidatus Dadabacteria bacterium]
MGLSYPSWLELVCCPNPPFVLQNNLITLTQSRLKSGNGDYVFVDARGDNIKTVRTAFEAACRRAGLGGLRFHDLRHTAATRMVESGANIVAISKILGHSDIKTTMRYTHPEDSLKDALESLGNFAQNATNIATNDDSIKSDVS